MSDIEKYNYKNLTPFKWFTIQNFPFIEADFDAITNYQLFSKVVEYLNNVINSQNSVGQEVENLSQAFIDLQNYVDNYFDNLDVQEEINNKLDSLVEDGTLTNLISTYLQPYIEAQNQVISEQTQTLNNAISQQNNAISQQNQNINTLEARVDEVTQLPSGSTSGDAELADIRVAYTSVSYDTAGNSVRAQSKNIAQTTMKNKVLSTSDFTVGQSINSTDGFISSNSTNYRSSYLLKYPVGTVIEIIIPAGFTAGILEYTDINAGTYSAFSNWKTSSFTYTVTKQYQRITVAHQGYSNIMTDEDLESFTFTIYQNLKDIKDNANSNLVFQQGYVDNTGAPKYVSSNTVALSNIIFVGTGEEVEININPGYFINIYEFDNFGFSSTAQKSYLIKFGKIKITTEHPYLVLSCSKELLTGSSYVNFGSGEIDTIVDNLYISYNNYKEK